MKAADRAGGKRPKRVVVKPAGPAEDPQAIPPVTKREQPAWSAQVLRMIAMSRKYLGLLRENKELDLTAGPAPRPRIEWTDGNRVITLELVKTVTLRKVAKK